MHNLLTVKETAKYLRIPLPTVYYLVQRGQLPAIQIGGRWRIKKSSLDKDILKEDKSGQPTVLVVDDDESLQNLFKLFLKKIGFSRVVVGTVKEALAALGILPQPRRYYGAGHAPTPFPAGFVADPPGW
jgi:excisionase family DNA binding protein